MNVLNIFHLSIKREFIDINLHIFHRFATEHISAIISALSLACICLAILLPVMFRFGVEKGRMSIILVFVIIFTFIGSSSEFNVTALPVMRALPALLAAAAVVINAVSIPLATRLYAKRDV